MYCAGGELNPPSANSRRIDFLLCKKEHPAVKHIHAGSSVDLLLRSIDQTASAWNQALQASAPETPSLTSAAFFFPFLAFLPFFSEAFGASSPASSASASTSVALRFFSALSALPALKAVEEIMLAKIDHIKRAKDVSSLPDEEDDLPLVFFSFPFFTGDLLPSLPASPVTFSSSSSSSSPSSASAITKGKEAMH